MKKDGILPPRPGELGSKETVIKGVPFIVYINGAPITMSKMEALGALAQITQILMYLEDDGDNNGH